MIYYILIAAISALTLGLTAPFVRAQLGGPTPKSLTLKMICATGYIAVGILGIKITGTFTLFQKIMFGALVASWIGDLFLHLPKPVWFKGIGFLGFLSAHFFFIRAFFGETRAMNPDAKFFTIPVIAFVLCFDIFFVIFSKKTGMDLKPVMYIPLVIYSTVITTMLCQAVIFGITAYTAHGSAMVAVCAAVGALNFVASDFTISMCIFDKKQKNNVPLKMFNMFTYFIAELLLALLITLY